MERASSKPTVLEPWTDLTNNSPEEVTAGDLSVMGPPRSLASGQVTPLVKRGSFLESYITTP